MNTFRGNIEEVRPSGSLCLVKIRVADICLSAIVIDSPESTDYLRKGQEVVAIFKETEVIIGKGTEQNISLQNRFTGPIMEMDSGELLSRIIVESSAGKITSIITSNAVRQLGLQIGDIVTAMVKTNEIMLST